VSFLFPVSWEPCPNPGGRVEEGGRISKRTTRVRVSARTGGKGE
jgi:hypothetical protein